MNVHTPHPMTVDEFLRWSLEQESGRYELEGGRVIQMQSQNLAHVRTKQRAYQALTNAIERADLPLYAMPDGPSIRIEGNRCYEPDALVAALPMPPSDSLEVPNPIVVVEVLSPSPSSIRRDLQTKLVGYGLVASTSITSSSIRTSASSSASAARPDSWLLPMNWARTAFCASILRGSRCLWPGCWCLFPSSDHQPFDGPSVAVHDPLATVDEPSLG
jgi:hypothetical protein